MEAISFLVLAVLAGMAASELHGLAPAGRTPARRPKGPRREGAAQHPEAARGWSTGLLPCASCP